MVVVMKKVKEKNQSGFEVGRRSTRGSQWLKSPVASRRLPLPHQKKKKNKRPRPTLGEYRRTRRFYSTPADRTIQLGHTGDIQAGLSSILL